jgi:hypothetical protein
MKRLLVLLAACGGDKLPVKTLEDPNTCSECHMQHYTQWSGSMHAYASDDPVMLAMNKRGQRDTQNQLGKFCLQCHAPMAVALGIVTDANAADFDPTTLPPQARGITCYFCHNVKKVIDDHNNGLQLALDQTMRGAVHDPVDSPAHDSTYDKMMDAYTDQSVMCGSCHDVVTPRGVALERTYTEWQGSIFSTTDPARELPKTCTACHMQSDPSTTVIADKPGLAVKSRTDSFHLHEWPAIDQAMIDFPETATQTAAIQEILDPALLIVGGAPVAGGAAPGGICLDPPGTLTVRMVTGTPGHMYPSGAAQDRRTWLELIAYDSNNNILFQSGTVADGTDPDPAADPSLIGFWDRTYQDSGMPAHFFWDVATVQSKLLLPPVTFDPSVMGYDHSTTATFNLGPQYTNIEKITARLRTRPLPFATLDELVSTGDLDASIASKFRDPKYTLGSVYGTAVWTKDTKGMGIGSMNTNCNPNPPLPNM